MCTLVFLPLSAVLVVRFPLSAGRHLSERVVVMEEVLDALAVFPFGPIIVTGSWRLARKREAAVRLKRHEVRRKQSPPHPDLWPQLGPCSNESRMETGSRALTPFQALALAGRSLYNKAGGSFLPGDDDSVHAAGLHLLHD